MISLSYIGRLDSRRLKTGSLVQVDLIFSTTIMQERLIIWSFVSYFSLWYNRPASQTKEEKFVKERNQRTYQKVSSDIHVKNIGSKSDNSKVPYLRAQHVGHGGARTHNPMIVSPATFPLCHTSLKCTEELVHVL